jgi:hypothetical protein
MMGGKFFYILWDLLKEAVLQIFITLKNPSAFAGFELTNVGSSGEHVTIRLSRQTFFLCDIFPNPLFSF